MLLGACCATGWVASSFTGGVVVAHPPRTAAHIPAQMRYVKRFITTPKNTLMLLDALHFLQFSRTG
jgi:hypothetical protein